VPHCTGAARTCAGADAPSTCRRILLFRPERSEIPRDTGAASLSDGESWRQPLPPVVLPVATHPRRGGGKKLVEERTRVIE
jgi:hypothetical protein